MKWSWRLFDLKNKRKYFFSFLLCDTLLHTPSAEKAAYAKKALLNYF